MNKRNVSAGRLQGLDTQSAKSVFPSCCARCNSRRVSGESHEPCLQYSYATCLDTPISIEIVLQKHALFLVGSSRKYTHLSGFLNRDWRYYSCDCPPIARYPPNFPDGRFSCDRGPQTPPPYMPLPLSICFALLHSMRCCSRTSTVAAENLPLIQGKQHIMVVPHPRHHIH